MIIVLSYIPLYHYFLELSEYVQAQNFKVKCQVGPWNMDSNGSVNCPLQGLSRLRKYCWHGSLCVRAHKIYIHDLLLMFFFFSRTVGKE